MEVKRMKTEGSEDRREDGEGKKKVDGGKKGKAGPKIEVKAMEDNWKYGKKVNGKVFFFLV